MHLSDLPLITVQHILRDVVLDDEIVSLLRMRQVSRLFDIEIMKHLARTRLHDTSSLYNDICWQRRHDPQMSPQFQLRIISENIGVSVIAERLVASLAKVGTRIEEEGVQQAIGDTLDKFSLLPNKKHTIVAESLKPNTSRFYLDELSRNLFSIAVAVPYTPVYEALLEEGFVPCYETQFLPSPLEIAFQTKNIEATKKILQNDAVISEDPPHQYGAVLNMAAEKGEMGTVTLFLQYKHRSTKSDRRLTRKAGFKALRAGNFEVAQLLFRRYKRGYTTRWNISYFAADKGAAELFEEYLDDSHLTASMRETMRQASQVNPDRRSVYWSIAPQIIDHWIRSEEC